MRKIVLRLYLQALEWYLDMPALRDNSNKTMDFLSNAWKHQGFREFATKRNDTLIHEAAGGAGLAPHDRTKYTELIGRRIELLNIIAMAKKSFEVEEQRNHKSGVDKSKS